MEKNTFLFISSYQDVTKNYSFEDGLEQIAVTDSQCKQANIFHSSRNQLKKIRKKPC
jgi:hypothetical protein